MDVAQGRIDKERRNEENGLSGEFERRLERKTCTTKAGKPILLTPLQHTRGWQAHYRSGEKGASETAGQM